MTNRQDRRYAAKLARQAARRGRTPAERALFSAAAAYSADRPMDLNFATADLDEAWRRLEPELRDLLDVAYDEFRRDVFAEAAWGRMVATSAAGEALEYDLEPILFPVTGKRGDVLTFAEDPASLAVLADSLRVTGVFPEEAALIVLPALLAPEAADLSSVGPAAAARLTTSLAELFMAASPSENEAATAAEASLREAGLPRVARGDDGEAVSGLMLGICLAPPEDWDVSDEEAEARHLAMAATRASWLDGFAAELPFRLGEPVFWHEAGSSLAWHAVAGQIEAELARHGISGTVARIDACLLPEEGDAVIVAESDGIRLGPFTAPRALVMTDIDGFADLAEHSAGEIVEHERVADVLRRLG